MLKINVDDDDNNSLSISMHAALCCWARNASE